MRLTSFVRRSTALAAATAMISSGGAVTGLLASPALAATVTVGAISPNQWDNRSSVLVTITGSGFNNATSLRDSVVLVPDAGVGDAAHEVGAFEVSANQSTSPTVLTATLNLAMAPAGSYHVVVKDPVSGASANPGTVPFTIFGYGSANANSVAVGANGTGADPLGIDCSFVSDCGRGALSLDLTGSNIAVGARVDFLKPSGATWVPDLGLSFAPGNQNNGSNPVGTEDGSGTAYTHTGYPSNSLLQGNYAYTFAGDDTPIPNKVAFTPGLHRLQIVNTDNKAEGSTVDFVQPWFSTHGVSPAAIGAGAQKVVLTVTGQGFRSGATLSVASGGNSTCGTDVSVGATTPGGQVADGTYTTLSAPVSFTGCAPHTGRAVTVVSPDGARFTRSGILQVVGAPTFTSLESGFRTLGQGASVGYAADGTWSSGTGKLITGTNFVGQGQTDPTKMTSFSLGKGVTVVTRAIINATTAEVTIDVAPDAVTGDHDAVATNPDGGSATTTKGPGPLATAPLTVNVGPKISAVDPAGLNPSSVGPTSVTATGTFNSSDSYTVAITPAGGIPNPSTPTATATTLTFSVLANGATPGPRVLTVTDSNDHGRAVCTACLGVNSLTILNKDGVPVAPGANAVAGNGSSTPVVLTMQGTGMEGVTASSTATLTRQVPLSGQGPIVGSGLAPVTANQASAGFNLLDAAPGKYNLTVVLNPGAVSPTSWQCTGCVTVTGTAITTTAVNPANGGQGATDRQITITGTHFSHGMTVGIGGGVTVHDVAFVSPTTLTALVDVPTTASTGSQTVTVTAGDGSQATNLSFTVNAAPSSLAVAPTSYGQGAGTAPGSTLKLSVTGSALQDHAVLALGPNVSTTFVPGSFVAEDTTPLVGHPASFDATIGIAEAALTGKRLVTVTNPDGGVGTLTDGFTVNPGPKVLSVSDETGAPALRPDGTQHVITIVGSGFDTHGLAVAFGPSGGITPGAPTVVSADKITIPVTVDPSATLGPRTVSVLNAADKGYGTCACAYVASKPGSPAPLTLTGGPGSLLAAWPAAAPNGAPVTAYRLAYAQVGLTSVHTMDLPASARSATLGGLSNGASYNVAVLAVNAMGSGPAALGTGVAGLTATLSLATTTTRVSYPGKVIVTGRLLGVGGAPLASRTVVLSFTPAVGRGYVKPVTTNAAGAFSLGVISPYTMKVQALWAGDLSYRTTASSYRAWSVAARVLKTAPVTGSKSRVGTVLTISGNVTPNKSGRIVYLLRYVNHRWYVVQRVRVSSRSTYAFGLKPARGTYIFRVTIGATPGNTAGSTGAFRLYRV
jgi:hypothetical protein